ncbi:MAG: transporter [Akkermansiaceae bacterium]
MKKYTTIAACAVAMTSTSFAGSEKSIPMLPAPSDGFASARHTISNPTLFDSALPQTQARLIYMHHRFPSNINIAGGGQVPMGGDLNLYALQLEYAFNERLSLVAMKDGYVDFNPDNTFTADTGFANIAAGLKYAFILDHANQYALSGSAVVELPTGSEGVFQGKGDGYLNLTLQNLKIKDKWQFAGALGVQVPFDSDFATNSFAAFHVSYEVTPWFIPLIELNYFRVLDSGDGGARFNNQVGGGVPAVATFEGADLLNWGAANSDGADYATLAVGFRSRLSEQCSIGLSYEFSLTDEEDNITDDRFTFDLTYTF